MGVFVRFYEVFGGLFTIRLFILGWMKAMRFLCRIGFVKKL